MTAADVAALSPTRWREVERVVDALLDAPEAEREALLAARCGDDAPLRALALTWLRACEESAGVLDDREAALATLAASPLAVGARVGPWRVTGEAGRGGMGVVYVAQRDDGEVSMRVALKVMAQLATVDPLAIRRFREERRILATLEHPGIARLVDGGVSAEGLPWFAMEYVDGAPIDRWCDERALPLDARLRLFCAVCDAVHHAHRRLVVHRDIKPSNVLVTGDGDVRLLDFGIAKLLDPAADTSADGAPTRTEARPMTPAYASPEQLRGEAVTTATDVYSLGALLHLLLCGRLPFAVARPGDHRTADDAPTRPSVAVRRAAADPDDPDAADRAARARGSTPARLARRLRGDLDTIVLRAMHPEPDRRYATADALAADVRRHLDGMPVLARPDTAAYRLRKLVRRHPLGVGAAVAAALVLAGFSAVTAAQARRVAAERDRAEQVTAFLAGLIRATDPYGSDGRAATMRDVLDRGAERARTELRAQPEVRARLYGDIAQAYSGLGEWTRAGALLEEAVRVQRALPGGEGRLAASLAALAQVRVQQFAPAAAESLYREALRLARAAPGPPGPDTARVLSGLGSALRLQRRQDEARAVLHAALALERARRPLDSLGVAQLASNLAHVLRNDDAHAPAERLYREALALHRATLGDEHPETANSVVNLAYVRELQGDLTEAEALYRRGLATKHRLLGRSHPDAAVDEASLGRVLTARGATHEAEAILRGALRTHRAHMGDVHPLVAHDLHLLGLALMARGDARAAEAVFAEGLAIRRATLAPGDPTLRQADSALAAARAALPGRR